MLLSSTKPQAETFSPNTMAAGPPAPGHPSAPRSTAGCCKGPGSGSALPHGPTQLMCHGPATQKARPCIALALWETRLSPCPTPGKRVQRAVPSSRLCPPAHQESWPGSMARRPGACGNFTLGGRARPSSWPLQENGGQQLPWSPCSPGAAGLGQGTSPGGRLQATQLWKWKHLLGIPRPHFPAHGISSLCMRGMGLAAQAQASPPHAGRWLDPQLPGPGRET